LKASGERLLGRAEPALAASNRSR